MSPLFSRRRRRAAQLLTRSQAMAARPIRNPSLVWHEDDEGNAVVILPRRNDTVGKILAWLFTVPESKPVVLDEIGTRVWKLCDGEHSVHDIATMLVERYKITMREAEVSLAEFLRRLGKRGMVAFALPTEVAEQLTDEQKKALGIVHPQEARARSRKQREASGGRRNEGSQGAEKSNDGGGQGGN
ncbi:MAG: PqqD family protein [Armatimonadetes bacterium]|nr:PqqD family protein [Armatimonadota bacterium]